jgi:hypothetical protein
VRDADSVLNLRERLAVDDWLASGRWFHIMRDWWSHTDLVLAGMWGGVAGVLPPCAADGELSAQYHGNTEHRPVVLARLFMALSAPERGYTIVVSPARCGALAAGCAAGQ